MKEISLQPHYFGAEPVETVYFGGGTPSLLDTGQVQQLLQQVSELHQVAPDAEITLEANPDDLSPSNLESWKDAGINRLSIGVQSFFEEDLRWMNRAHSARQALDSLPVAQGLFPNSSIDLIYGTPGLTNEKWKENADRAIGLGIRHLSCYALTVEPRTPLDKLIRQHRRQAVDPDQQSDQFLLLMDWLDKAGYEHYEISNFAKPGFRSRHNSAYWKGVRYLGIGPSAHSFDGTARWWNIANNQRYIEALKEDRIPLEKETLTAVQRTNEYIMISLRTMEGLDLSRLDETVSRQVEGRSQRYIELHLVQREGDHLRLTKEGKLLADGIAADLFI